MTTVIPIIMAGGSGTRLWPLSRALYPKQFIPLVSDQSLLQSTALLSNRVANSPSITVCNEKHRFLVAEQLREVNQLGQVLLEPTAKNTAPAIALAALHALHQEKDPVLIVFAADHLIKQKESFINTAQAAIEEAQSGSLITFGIVPSKAETGYGYIKTSPGSNNTSYPIEQFVEKPDLATAKAYLESGDYFWNSGMFVFKAQAFLNELEKLSPQIFTVCKQSMENTASDLDFIRVDEKIFQQCPEDSIDYAVMEKTQNARVVPLDADWSDIGSFSAIWDVTPKDENGNSLLGDVIAESTEDSLVMSDHGLVVSLGMKDAVVINTKDTVLVADKSRSQEIKTVVNKLKKADRTEWEFHKKVYRPWGTYETVDEGQRYQVKRITVKPGARLSIQMHHHRAEHWIVVKGTAKIGINEVEKLLSENESVYIPLGAVHFLENPGQIMLELIEVQTGSYLGEDDIVRFNDKYGRS